MSVGLFDRRYYRCTLVGGPHDGGTVALEAPPPTLKTWPTLEIPLDVAYERSGIDWAKGEVTYEYLGATE